MRNSLVTTKNKPNGLKPDGRNEIVQTYAHTMKNGNGLHLPSHTHTRNTSHRLPRNAPCFLVYIYSLGPEECVNNGPLLVFFVVLLTHPPNSRRYSFPHYRFLCLPTPSFSYAFPFFHPFSTPCLFFPFLSFTPSVVPVPCYQSVIPSLQ